MSKKWIFGIGMVVAMLGLGSMAQAKTYYCVPYAYGTESDGGDANVSVATIISMHVGEDAYDRMACDTGCENEWTDYLRGNYTKYFHMSKGVLGPYEHESDAKHEYNNIKSDARHKWNHPFHHATDFSCSGD